VIGSTISLPRRSSGNPESDGFRDFLFGRERDYADRAADGPEENQKAGDPTADITATERVSFAMKERESCPKLTGDSAAFCVGRRRMISFCQLTNSRGCERYRLGMKLLAA